MEQGARVAAKSVDPIGDGWSGVSCAYDHQLTRRIDQAVDWKHGGASSSVIASVAKQSRIVPQRRSGLLRRKSSSQ
ncbi:protein of unknown function [Bradyrhizobium vignae]|uniref:Uncharacterized protein n=1 Tax=Bradyrhizobium vignae TaxID=1549949 RepID=A0A2U3Q854_9BRAD|nr:protein of unknown function [Bradyrhizobium vignae]